MSFLTRLFDWCLMMVIGEQRLPVEPNAEVAIFDYDYGSVRHNS